MGLLGGSMAGLFGDTFGLQQIGHQQQLGIGNNYVPMQWFDQQLQQQLTLAKPDHRPYWRARAERIVDEGSHVCCLIAFWTAVRPLLRFVSDVIVVRLVDRLEAMNDELEQCSTMIAA